MDNNPSGFAGTATVPKNTNPPPYMRGKNGAMYSARRNILPPMPPGVAAPKDRDYRTFADAIAKALVAQLEMERDSMAIAAGQDGYDKPLPKSTIARCRKQAKRLADANMPKAPARKRKGTGGGRHWNKENAAVYYKANAIVKGEVKVLAFQGGRGHASAAGYKWTTPEAATEAYLAKMAMTDNPELIATAIEAGHVGPVNDEVDDEAIEAAASKPGFFASLFRLRKLFG